MKPVVSVVIPTRNRPQELAAALTSIAAQDLDAPVEVLVINDGGASVDGVVAEIRGDLDIRLLTLAANEGVSVARNAGLDAARGRYIAFLDDDDVYLPGHLRTAVSVLESQPVDVVYTSCGVVGERVDLAHPELTPRFSMLDFSFNCDALGVVNYIPSLSILARAACFTNTRFDPSLRLREDWDMWLQLAWGARLSFEHIPQETVVYHRLLGRSSATASTHMSLDVQRRFREDYQRFVQRWPVAPGSPVDVFRGYMLLMYDLALQRLERGEQLAIGHYPQVLRVLLNAMERPESETDVPARLAQAIASDSPPN